MATPTDDGFRVSGRCSFASGRQHSHWFIAHCIADDGRQPPIRMMVLPSADVQINDTWSVSGLCGTGSFVALVGFDQEVAALRAANPRPAPGAIEWPVPADPLLDQLATIGDQPTNTSRLPAWDERADIVAVCVGPGRPDAVLTAVAAGAPRVPFTVAS